MRAIIVDVTGPVDPNTGRAPVERVVFDRHGLNSYVFEGRTWGQALNQAPMDALTAVMEKRGTDWVESHTIREVP